MTSDEFQFVLTRDQALVLQDWLDQFGEADEAVFRHPAEQKVVWRLEAMLEKWLTEPFLPDYHDRLHAARSRLEAND